MPSTSWKQHKFMEAIKHSPEFARKVAVPQSVGRDFSDADDKAGITMSHEGQRHTRYATGGEIVNDSDRYHKKSDDGYRTDPGTNDPGGWADVYESKPNIPYYRRPEEAPPMREDKGRGYGDEEGPINPNFNDKKRAMNYAKGGMVGDNDADDNVENFTTDNDADDED